MFHILIFFVSPSVSVSCYLYICCPIVSVVATDLALVWLRQACATVGDASPVAVQAGGGGAGAGGGGGGGSGGAGSSSPSVPGWADETPGGGVSSTPFAGMVLPRVVMCVFRDCVEVSSMVLRCVTPISDYFLGH